MEFKIPTSLQLEHEELHAELAKATKITGKLGDAAKNVANILDPHFRKEEEFALPPLGLLVPWAEGQTWSKMSEVLLMTARLKTDLPQMLEEHKAIVEALKDLIKEAKKASKPEYISFAEKLTLHAKNEEEVLYPAALLVGEYIELKLSK
jgi:NAD(P)H-dependent flavin oxidoreductase YrpB (nitropropane dioxygenase family)